MLDIHVALKRLPRDVVLPMAVTTGQGYPDVNYSDYERFRMTRSDILDRLSLGVLQQP